MDEPTTPTSPTTPVMPVIRQRSTFGSLATAMALGAFIAVSLLYMWGAQIAKEEGVDSSITK